MKSDFLCPKCLGYLSVGKHVIFTVRSKKHMSGLLLLSPVLGDYAYDLNPSFGITPGEELDFYCPICHASLSVEGTNNLASVILQDDDEGKHHVIFSRVIGEQCTYKITGQKVEKYGANANMYVDFISASMMK